MSHYYGGIYRGRPALEQQRARWMLMGTPSTAEPVVPPAVTLRTLLMVGVGLVFLVAPILAI